MAKDCATCGNTGEIGPLYDLWGEPGTLLCPDCNGASRRKPKPRPVDDPWKPVTPYAGTSGYSGTDTSKERALRDDANGTTSERQRIVMGALLLAGPQGLTWKELADKNGWHHGQASGALSVLHKDGRAARLTERRDRCRVYVHPEFVNGRETDAQGRKHECPNCGWVA